MGERAKRCWLVLKASSTSDDQPKSFNMGLLKRTGRPSCRRQLPNTLKECKAAVKRQVTQHDPGKTHSTSKIRSSISTHRAGSSSIILTHTARRCSAVYFLGSFALIAALLRSFGCGQTSSRYDFRTARGVKSSGGKEPPARGPAMEQEVVRAL